MNGTADWMSKAGRGIYTQGTSAVQIWYHRRNHCDGTRSVPRWQSVFVPFIAAEILALVGVNTDRPTVVSEKTTLPLPPNQVHTASAPQTRSFVLLENEK